MRVFNAAMSALVKSGRWEKAVDISSGMEANGAAPNVINYTTAIKACEEGK